MTQQVMDIEEVIKTDHLIGLDNFFNVYHLLRHRLGHTTHTAFRHVLCPVGSIQFDHFETTHYSERH